jgi:uncharacterized protein (DUF433 family)
VTTSIHKAPETVPLYTVADTARFARATHQTLRRWAEGYRVGRRDYPPLLVLPADQPPDQPALSFENLIEAALIAQWRRRGIPLQRIRRAHALAIEEVGQHPFARHRIYVAGRDLFIEADEATKAEKGNSFTVLTKGGQRALAPAIEEYLRTIDWRSGNETLYERDAPYQWRPPEGDDVVKLNPELTFGQPAVRRVRTEVLLQRFLARESVWSLADDFRLEPSEVEQGIRYEFSLMASPALARAA